VICLEGFWFRYAHSLYSSVGLFDMEFTGMEWKATRPPCYDAYDFMMGTALGDISVFGGSSELVMVERLEYFSSQLRLSQLRLAVQVSYQVNIT